MEKDMRALVTFLKRILAVAVAVTVVLLPFWLIARGTIPSRCYRRSAMAHIGSSWVTLINMRYSLGDAQGRC